MSAARPARTIAFVLQSRAESLQTLQPALHLRADGHWTTWSWAGCLQRARQSAAGLRAAGLRRADHVLVLAVEPEPAVWSILGAWWMGASVTPVGVSLRAQDSRREGERLARLGRRLGARALLAPRAWAAPAGVCWEAMRLLVAEDTVAAPDAAAAHEGVAADEDAAALALIQLTSGSTGEPRGVCVPHDRLLAHLDAMRSALPLGDGAVGYSWLPLYHDMGLIGGLLLSLYAGFELRLSSPLAFRASPWHWLSELAAFGAQITPAPPSAWRLCVPLAARAAAAGLDLSGLRCALVGAEPVSPAALRQFAAAYAPCGFRAEAFFPVYGMAEATLAVTFPKLGSGARFDDVSARALALARAEPARGGEPSATFTGLGQPLPGTSLRICGEARAILPERSIGEILVRSATLMTEYHADPPASAEALADEWLRTGDLGYLADGELFVTGRKKELVVRAGQKLVPAFAEEIAAGVDGVRAGAAALVGIWSEAYATERAVLVAETRRPPDGHRELERAVHEALAAQGVTVDEVHLVRPGALPRTSSGKLIRSRVAELLGRD